MMFTQVALIFALFAQLLSAQNSIATQYIEKRADQSYLSSILSGSLTNELVLDTDVSSGSTVNTEVFSATGVIVNSEVTFFTSTKTVSHSQNQTNMLTSSSSNQTAPTVADSQNFAAINKYRSTGALVVLCAWLGLLM